jgi:hypothetical protein
MRAPSITIPFVCGISFLLMNCSEKPPSNCETVKSGESWMNKTVQSREDLRDEIDALIIDNRCDGITPAKLHKVLRDLERIGDR